MPFRVFSKAIKDDVVVACPGRRRLAEEAHPRASGGTPGFSLIAGLARAYYVLPNMLPSEVAWDNVVYGEFPGLLAAVLARVTVSDEDLTSA